MSLHMSPKLEASLACREPPHASTPPGGANTAACMLLVVDACGQRVRGVCAGGALEGGAMLCSGHYATLEMVAHFFTRTLLQAADPASLCREGPHATAPLVLERTKAEVGGCMSGLACLSACLHVCMSASEHGARV
jgi:hypothetical protein